MAILEFEENRLSSSEPRRLDLSRAPRRAVQDQTAGRKFEDEPTLPQLIATDWPISRCPAGLCRLVGRPEGKE